MNIKNKYIMILFLALLISLATISTSLANNGTDDEIETVKIISKHDTGKNDYLDSANISGNEYRGLCVNNTLYSPQTNMSFNVSKDTSAVSQKVKNIITKYYRENNTFRTNYNIQVAIWQVIEGVRGYPINTSNIDKMIISQMYFDQEGVVNDTYIDSNGIKYVFDFKYLTTTQRALNQVVQDMLMFRYDIVNNSTNITPPNNNTTPPNNNTTPPNNNLTPPTNTTPPNNFTPPNNNTEIPINNDSDQNQTINSQKPPIKLNDIKAGIPFISLFLVVLISLGFIGPKD